MNEEPPSKSARLITLWLSLLAFLIGIITNIATSVLPALIQPYLWLSWLILGLLIILYLGISWTTTDTNSGFSYKSKSLGQKAINSAQWETLRNRIGEKKLLGLRVKDIKNITRIATNRISEISLSSLKSIILAVNYIDIEIQIALHRTKVAERIQKIEMITNIYSDAIKFVEAEEKAGRLSHQDSVQAIETLQTDFYTAMDKSISESAK